MFSTCRNLTEISVESSNNNYSSENGVLFNKAKTELIRCPGGKTGACLVPSSVTTVNASAFSYCRNLTEINVESGNNNYSSENGVLFNKVKTELIKCPGGKTGVYLIPNSVTTIGDSAFSRCDSLSKITIPGSVNTIGRSAFAYCASLAEINVESSNNNYSSENGVLFNKAKTELIQCPGGKTGVYLIPNSVTTIGSWALGGCDSLTDIIIPGSVTAIGDYAFAGCNKLKDITIQYGLATMGEFVFQQCTSLTHIIIPGSVNTIGVGAFFQCTGLTNVNIQDGVTAIDENAFAECTNLVNVTIQNGVEEIGEYAFDGCISLKNVIIPGSVTTISKRAFSGCTSLVSITIPDGVVTIDDNAFYGCTSLENITIPKSVTKMGSRSDVFYECISLKDVYYGGTEDDWRYEVSSCPTLDKYIRQGKVTIHFNSEGPKTFTDPDSGISANVPADAIESGVTFVAEKVDQAPANIEINGVLFDIYFEKDGESVQPKGEVTVSIPVPEGKDGDKCTVYYIDASGNKTDMNARHENGYMVFKTGHFSYYSVEEAETATMKGDINNDTKVNAQDKAILNRYLAGWEGYEAMILNWDAADIDGSGDVTGRDKAILNRYLAGWEGYDSYFAN